jgi:serine/threonine protein kinase
MDLKPENILIDDNGQLILTDFGINRYFFNKCSENLIGTKEYLSPELIAGGNHSRNSDWWCLGMLLYEMLMTVPAFLHPDENQMFFMISVARPYFP